MLSWCTLVQAKEKQVIVTFDPLLKVLIWSNQNIVKALFDKAGCGPRNGCDGSQCPLYRTLYLISLLPFPRMHWPIWHMNKATPVNQLIPSIVELQVNLHPFKIASSTFHETMKDDETCFFYFFIKQKKCLKVIPNKTPHTCWH